MAKSKFFEQIKGSLIEREVEDVYNKGISLYFPDVDIKHPFACDGFVDTTIDNKMLKLLIEYKFDEDFTSRAAIAKVLLQVLYYMKQFEINGEILPNVILVGDINECFVMHSNAIIKYLDEDLDWSIAPSQAYKDNADVILKMAEDNDIAPFVYSINGTFSFQAVAEKIKALAAGVKRYVHITEHNISVIYDYFTKRVVKKASKVQPNDLVAIFMGVILDGENYYQHPKKNNILVTPMGNVNIDGAAYKAYCEHFSREYTIKEKDKFAEISDRLIEDTNRRNKGEFYTPTLFVDYAHQMISSTFGADWREKYVVWDNCAGSKNLTRDYRFKELYSSTLEMAELEISKRYNPEATSFQFDFLNDPLEKLPEGLLRAFEENKPILFFINPPYATAANFGEVNKGGVAKTMIYEEMMNNNIGRCSSNLYAQFLYRIMLIKEQYNLTNVHIALFSPTLFLTGPAWKKFRNAFFAGFAFNNAVQFKASHFADVADSWGISFSIWNGGVNADNSNFGYTLIDNIDGEIKVVGEKDVYNTDGLVTASDWAKEETKKIKVFDAPNMTNGINIKMEATSKTNPLGKLAENALGYLFNNSNNIDKNTQEVAMFSSVFSHSVGVQILPINFTKCTALFSARKLIEKNWVNSKDEYLAPNEEHPQYQEFVNDSIIFSLFHSASNQSSLRQVEYKGKKWDIKNEFFFMSKNEILELADECSNDECYMDARTDNERYVYELLQNITLSPEAQAVLDYARELTKKTFKYRKLFNESHPEYQINNWDCGFYQLKALWKEYAPKEYEEFKELFKNLANKMRPMVYELGFLK